MVGIDDLSWRRAMGTRSSDHAVSQDEVIDLACCLSIKGEKKRVDTKL